MAVFRLESVEEKFAREAREAAEDPELADYDKRAMANARPHCLCGRFARPGRDLGQDFQGEYNWTVYCKEHGEVWMN